MQQQEQIILKEKQENHDNGKARSGFATGLLVMTSGTLDQT
ncbi:hypothetical protein BH10ACI4_BH10ACI4_04280 [soil metagenome]